MDFQIFFDATDKILGEPKKKTFGHQSIVFEYSTEHQSNR